MELGDPTPSAVLRVQYKNNVITSVLYFAFFLLGSGSGSGSRARGN